MTIGEAIKKARNDKGYSRAKLSRRSGIGVATICLWESDKSNPTVVMLICIADVLGVTLDELVGRTVEG